MKVEELLSLLAIPSGVEHQCLKRPGLHGVIPVIMGVDVLSKLEEEMLVELYGLASYHGTCD